MYFQAKIGRVLVAFSCLLCLLGCNSDGRFKPDPASSGMLTVRCGVASDIQIKAQDEINTLYDVGVDNPTMVIYLHNVGCQPCAAKEIALLNAVVKNANNIAIIGMFDNERQRKIFEQQTKLRTYKACDELSLKNASLPCSDYAFVTDGNGVVYNLLDLDDHPDLTSDYYVWFQKLSAR